MLEDLKLMPRTLGIGIYEGGGVVLFPYYVRMYTNILFLLFFVDFGLGGLELTPRTLGKGKVRVVEFLYYVRTFTNVIISFFFVNFGLGDLKLTPRTLGKGKCKGDRYLLCK